MRNYLQPTYIAKIRVGTEDSPENEWRRLLKIAFTLFEVPPDGMTFLTSCEFLHRVLSLSNKMTDILPFLEKKFDFFEKILDSSQLKVILKCCLLELLVYTQRLRQFAGLEQRGQILIHQVNKSVHKSHESRLPLGGVRLW